MSSDPYATKRAPLPPELRKAFTGQVAQTGGLGRGGLRILCRSCRTQWAYPPGKELSGAAILRLLEHAAEHEPRDAR